MATRTHEKSTVEFEIVPDEIDGWDVKKRVGLLVAITLLVIVISLIGSLTDFGA